MNILLQTKVPAQESLKWQIHEHSYQTKGLALWTKRDIPFNGTSNFIAAQQKALMVIRILHYLKQIPETIYILETGAGTGVFAVNFIKAFQSICQQNQLPFFDKLCYLLSDFSLNTLKQTASQSYIQDWIEKGVLRLGCLDFTQPKSWTSFDDSSFQLHTGLITALICNYQLCVFPSAVLKIKNKQFYQKYIELYYQGHESEPPPVEKLRQEDIYEVGSYEPLLIEEYTCHPIEQRIFKSLLEKYPLATFNHQTIVFESLLKWMDYLIPDGVVLVSDKAYSSFSMIEGQSEFHPSSHGDTLGTLVNLPLLELFLSEANYQVLRTSNHHYVLQTMLIGKHVFERNIEDFFQHIYCQVNNNNKAQYLLKKASQAYKERDFHQAISIYKRLLPSLPRDPVLLSSLGMAYLSIGELENALQCFLSPKDDYLNLYSSYIPLAEIYAQMGQFETSISFYEKALDHLENKAFVYYNLGICWAKLEKWSVAEDFFNKARLLNPEDSEIIDALKAVRFELAKNKDEKK